MALAKWRIGPAEWLVKVVPHARTGAVVVTGYVTQLKFVAGRTPEEMERTLGVRRSELAEGASVLWLGRLPDWAEFALRGYTQCPGGERYDSHGAYPPELGVRQWKLLCALRWVSEWSLRRERDCELVGNLQRKMGTSPKAEYDRLQRVSDEARVKSEQSRLALEQHVAAHRC